MKRCRWEPKWEQKLINRNQSRNYTMTQCLKLAKDISIIIISVLKKLETWKLCESYLVLYNSLWPHGLYSLWNSPGQNTGVGSLSLLQGIFPAQGLNPGLMHCRWILYQVSHQGSMAQIKFTQIKTPKYAEWIKGILDTTERNICECGDIQWKL